MNKLAIILRQLVPEMSHYNWFKSDYTCIPAWQETPNVSELSRLILTVNQKVLIFGYLG